MVFLGVSNSGLYQSYRWVAILKQPLNWTMMSKLNLYDLLPLDIALLTLQSRFMYNTISSTLYNSPCNVEG